MFCKNERSNFLDRSPRDGPSTLKNRHHKKVARSIQIQRHSSILPGLAGDVPSPSLIMRTKSQQNVKANAVYGPAHGRVLTRPRSQDRLMSPLVISRQREVAGASVNRHRPGGRASSGGTGSSNPLPSSGESGANLTYSPWHRSGTPPMRTLLRLCHGSCVPRSAVAPRGAAQGRTQAAHRFVASVLIAPRCAQTAPAPRQSLQALGPPRRRGPSLAPVPPRTSYAGFDAGGHRLLRRPGQRRSMLLQQRDHFVG
jgi:hypothetical protein